MAGIDVATPAWSAPNGDAGSQANTDLDHDAVARSTRKRGSRSVRQPLSSKVREKESQQQLLLARLQQLSIDSLLSIHRHAMLELVLEVEDSIVAARQAPACGPVLGSTNMQDAGPDELHALRKAAIGKLAVSLAGAMPLLESRPELLTPQRNFPPSAGNPTHPAPAITIARRMLAEFVPRNATERVQLVALEAAVDEEVALHASLMKLCVQQPSTPLGASVHGSVHSTAQSWGKLRSAVAAVGDGNVVMSRSNVSACTAGSSGSAPGATPPGSSDGSASSLSHRLSSTDDAAAGEWPGDGHISPPLVAPEEHWRGVMKGAALSDWQRLHAKLLWDVVQSARQGVASLRACLVRSMLKPGLAADGPSHHHHDDDGCGADQGGGCGGVGVKAPPILGPAVASPLVNVHTGAMDGREAAVQRLCATLTRDHSLYLVAADILMGRILLPQQAALVTVTCAPYAPDVFALLYAAAAEYTPQVAERLVEQGKQQQQQVQQQQDKQQQQGPNVPSPNVTAAAPA